MRLESLNPIYAYYRFKQKRYESANSWAPWLTPVAITALQELIKSSDVGFEFGSGRSTIWLARLSRKLYSMESAPEWYERVKDWIQRENLTEKVSYHLAPTVSDTDDICAEDHPYVQRMSELSEGSLDFVLVDGMMRLTCMRLAMKKLRPGGVLILDNANRYFPNKFQEGYTTVSGYRDAPLNDEWARTWAVLSEWRGFNTTDRIWDTRFWFKPV